MRTPAVCSKGCDGETLMLVKIRFRGFIKFRRTQIQLYALLVEFYLKTTSSYSVWRGSLARAHLQFVLFVWRGHTRSQFKAFKEGCPLPPNKQANTQQAASCMVLSKAQSPIVVTESGMAIEVGATLITFRLI